jgi:hypothetical protein
MNWNALTDLEQLNEIISFLMKTSYFQTQYAAVLVGWL